MIEKDGGVLLTKEEYSDYMLLQNDYKFAVENIDRLEGLLAKAQEKLIQFFKTRAEVQKETAKEIFGEMIEAIPKDENDIKISKQTIKYMASLYKAEVSDE